MFNQIQSGASIPQNIRIDGLTFVSTLTNADSMMYLDCLTDSIIEDCEFQGNAALQFTTSTMATAITMRANGAATCDNVTVKDCIFRNLATAIESNHDIVNVEITRNSFRNLNEGIVLARSLSGQPGQVRGPSRVSIDNNTFDLINKEGILVGPNVTGFSSVKSSNNVFANVGNGFGSTTGDLNQRHPVISFGSFGNSSTNDRFGRFTTINTSSLVNVVSIRPIVSGPSSFEMETVNPVVITGVGTFNLFVWPRSSYTVTNITSPGQNIEIEYVLSKSNTVRRGNLEIAVSGNASTITDKFSYDGVNDGNVSFSVNLTRSDSIIIEALNTGINGTVTYKANIRQ